MWSAAQMCTAAEWEVALTPTLVVAMAQPSPLLQPLACFPFRPMATTATPCHPAHCQVLVSCNREVQVCFGINGNGDSLWSAAKALGDIDAPWRVTLCTLTITILVTITQNNCDCHDQHTNFNIVQAFGLMMILDASKSMVTYHDIHKLIVQYNTATLTP